MILILTRTELEATRCQMICSFHCSERKLGVRMLVIERSCDLPMDSIQGCATHLQMSRKHHVKSHRELPRILRPCGASVHGYSAIFLKLSRHEMHPPTHIIQRSKSLLCDHNIGESECTLCVGRRTAQSYAKQSHWDKHQAKGANQLAFARAPFPNPLRFTQVSTRFTISQATSMRLTALLTAASAVGVAIAADSSSSSNSSSGRALVGWYPCSDYTFSDEGTATVNAECAIYKAPLCYTGICDDSSNATVDVFVKRILASKDSSSYPNVWFFQGGPGADSSSMESAMVDLRNFLNLEVNVYTMDHRGTGRSTRLECVAAQAMTSGSPNGADIGVSEVPSCAEELQEKYGDLSSFSITSAATDISTFISTFTPGETTYVYGVSYGTALVERLIHLDTPEVVGYILDGIATASGSSLDKFENYSRWDSDFGEVADRFLVQCANDTSCSTKFSSISLPDKLTQLMDSLDNNPNSTCASLLTTAGLDNPSYVLRKVFQTLLGAASTRSLIPVVTYRLDRCNSDDVDVLTHFITKMTSSSASSEDDGYWSKLLYYLIVFSEMWETPEPSEEVMLERFVNSSVASGVYNYAKLYCAFSKEDSDTCNELGVGEYSADPIIYPRDKYFNAAATIPSQASVLLISSLLDTQTPHKYAESLYDALDGTAKELVVFQYATHATLFSTPVNDASSITCTMEILASYVMGGGDLSQISTTCVDAQPALSFEVATSILYAYLSTADAYEGSYDESLSTGVDAPKTYKTEFIVFASLFGVALLGCIALACCLRRRAKPKNAWLLEALNASTPHTRTLPVTTTSAASPKV